MKLLPLTFTKSTLVYKQLRRSKTAAIYSVSHKRTKRLLGYEAHIVRSHNGFVMGGNKVEPAEYLAGSSEFGTKGFYYACRDDEEDALSKATKKFKEIEV